MKKFFLVAVLGGMVSFGLSSCSSSDDETLLDADQAREEARDSINESNLEEEARRLREEIENN